MFIKDPVPLLGDYLDLMSRFVQITINGLWNYRNYRETGHLPVFERGSVSKRFLVICPFCGSRNEEVESKSKDCGAEFWLHKTQGW